MGPFWLMAKGYRVWGIGLLLFLVGVDLFPAIALLIGESCWMPSPGLANTLFAGLCPESSTLLRLSSAGVYPVLATLIGLIPSVYLLFYGERLAKMGPARKERSGSMG